MEAFGPSKIFTATSLNVTKLSTRATCPKTKPHTTWGFNDQGASHEFLESMPSDSDAQPAGCHMDSKNFKGSMAALVTCHRGPAAVGGGATVVAVRESIVAIYPDGVSTCTFDTTEHMGMKIFIRKKTTPLKSLRLTKAAAWRVSFPCHLSTVPVRCMELVRLAGGEALGVRQAQREWFVYYGIWPLDTNMMPGSKHFKNYRKLYALAKTHPINKALASASIPSKIEQLPYAARAYKHREEIQLLATRCPSKGLFQKGGLCSRPNCLCRNEKEDLSINLKYLNM